MGAKTNQKFSKHSQVRGGGGGSERLGVFPKFYRFYNWTASLSILVTVMADEKGDRLVTYFAGHILDIDSRHIY